MFSNRWLIALCFLPLSSFASLVEIRYSGVVESLYPSPGGFTFGTNLGERLNGTFFLDLNKGVMIPDPPYQYLRFENVEGQDGLVTGTEHPEQLEILDRVTIWDNAYPRNGQLKDRLDLTDAAYRSDETSGEQSVRSLEVELQNMDFTNDLFLNNVSFISNNPAELGISRAYWAYSKWEPREGYPFGWSIGEALYIDLNYLSIQSIDVPEPAPLWLVLIGVMAVALKGNAKRFLSRRQFSLRSRVS